ncbi:RNA-binding protein [Acetobacter musti]|uniref:RNA-binding protein n=1 Tax=Acetobacter musti TaxID=864732 RepID=A0ABX0JLN2_9PROT|nr:RNA-binding protein [Acetobacter musti]
MRGRRLTSPRRCLLSTTSGNERERFSDVIAASPSASPDLSGHDDADEDNEHGSLRRCAVTRERMAPAVMLRFVIGPDRNVVPDLNARLPGRGIWLSARRDVLETALTRGVFARAARRHVVIPSDLLAVVESGLLRRVVEILGLARRAGQSVSGYAKVREWIEARHAGLIVQASDGSPDECARLLSGARELPVVRPLVASSLGHVFGRERVVHAALRRGALASRLQQESERFAGVAGAVMPCASGISGDRVEQADK